jgi:anti-sigma B factor antagonist
MTADDPRLTPPDLSGWPFDIGITRDGDTVTIAISGEVDIGATDIVAGALRKVLDTDTTKIVLDLSELSHLDSTALEMFVRSTLEARQIDRLSVVPSKHEAVKQVLAATGIGQNLDS